jgi:hypothetical protein
MAIKMKSTRLLTTQHQDIERTLGAQPIRSPRADPQHAAQKGTHADAQGRAPRRAQSRFRSTSGQDPSGKKNEAKRSSPPQESGERANV